VARAATRNMEHHKLFVSYQEAIDFEDGLVRFRLADAGSIKQRWCTVPGVKSGMNYRWHLTWTEGEDCVLD
jgi:hypothetical protein